MIRALLAAAMLSACGSGSLIAGEWQGGFYAADAGADAGPVPCYAYGSPHGVIAGTFVIYDNEGKLSGQWDVCGSAVAGNDLQGRIHDNQFDFNLAGGAVGVVNGVTDFLSLSGDGTGLGADIVFRGKRKSSGKGKTLPPPGPDGS